MKQELHGIRIALSARPEPAVDEEAGAIERLASIVIEQVSVSRAH